MDYIHAGPCFEAAKEADTLTDERDGLFNAWERAIGIGKVVTLKDVMAQTPAGDLQQRLHGMGLNGRGNGGGDRFDPVVLGRALEKMVARGACGGRRLTRKGRVTNGRLWIMEQVR